MKRAFIFIVIAILMSVSIVHANDSQATAEDVYNLVLKAHEVVQALGEEAFPAFNDPKGEFVHKDTYALVQRCPGDMMAHPFAMAKLKGFDLTKLPFNQALCEAGEQPGGGWIEYEWPKPGKTEPSRKVSFVIKVEGTPYTVVAGIFSDTAQIDNLNQTLR